jgi:integrase
MLMKRNAMAKALLRPWRRRRPRPRAAGPWNRPGAARVLASSAEVDERYVQNQLGHASIEMTRRN